MAESEWKKQGPTFQRVYPDGTLLVVYRFVGRDGSGDHDWTAEAYGPNGGWNDCPTAAVARGMATKEDAFAELDKKYDRQPDLVDRTDETSYYRHGQKAAFVKRNVAGMWSWFRAQDASSNVMQREAAEFAAKSYVLTP